MLNGLSARFPFNALLSTKPMIIRFGSLARMALWMLSPSIPVWSVNVFTLTRVMGYLTVALASVLAYAIKIPGFILTHRTMRAASFIFIPKRPSFVESIRQNASLLRTSRTLILTPLMSILSRLCKSHCRYPTISNAFAFRKVLSLYETFVRAGTLIFRCSLQTVGCIIVP